MSEKHSTLTPVTGVPVEVPVGSNSTGASAQVSRVADQTRETNTPARDEPERPARPHSTRAGRGRIGGVQLARIAEGLSDRDRQLLGSIAAHGYLSTKHIEGLWFGGRSTTTAERLTRRAMTRLERLGLVQPLERRVGGVRAGSSARIWQLSAAGRRLVADHGGAKRPHEPSPRLLAHALAVADARVTIHQIPDVMPTISTIDTVDVKIEAAAWRRYLGLGGDRRLLQPDLAVTLYGHDEAGQYEDRWFIEVDCGTESIPTLLKKCRQYDDYRQSGTEQIAHDVFPRILWVMGGPRAVRRAQDLEGRLARADYPVGMFTVVLPDDVAGTLGGDAS